MSSSSVPLAACAMAAPSHLPTAPVAAVIVRDRRQMETRLRLRRRLLRMQVDGPPSDTDDQTSATGVVGELKHPVRPSKGKPAIPTSKPVKRGSSQTKAKPPVRSSSSRIKQSRRVEDNGTRSGEDDDGDAEDADEDGGENDEDEEEEGDGDDETATNTTSKVEKCEQSPVVKLLFSRSDPRGRVPTVWFDYPPHLQVTREPPSLTTGCVNRLVSVNATDCEIIYKTHWERNCVKNAFAAAGLRRTKKRCGGWHIAWAKHMPRDKFKCLQPNQSFSHFPDPWVIGRKDRLMKTLTSYKRRFGSSYAFFPEGFTLPDHLDAFKRATGSAPRSLWILKPPAAACGRGIRVLPACDVDAFLTHEKRKDRKYIAQKYLADPLLVGGFKFDLRIYVLVTSVDPLRIYLYEEGLTRFCTTPYSLENTKNRFAHLTNYSVNKNNKLFVENTNAESDNSGNKWSMTALLDHLQAQAVVKDVTKLRQQIKDIICKTLIAAEAHLTPLMHQFVKGFRTHSIKCFELFGFDLMLDDTCTPWLIEANVSPSLMAGSPLDRRVKGMLLSDIFHLVGVPVARETLPREMIPKTLQTVDTASNNASGVGSPSSAPVMRSSGVNRQLHEIALDAKRPVFEKKDLELFTSADWTMIHDMEDEMERLGHFERIFPCETAQETAEYAPYFTCPRYSNALCAKWIETKNRARAKATAAASSAAAPTGKKPYIKASRSNSFGGRTKVTRSLTTGVETTVNRLVPQAASR